MPLKERERAEAKKLFNSCIKAEKFLPFRVCCAAVAAAAAAAVCVYPTFHHFEAERETH
jgi:hypothetical protein